MAESGAAFRREGTAATPSSASKRLLHQRERLRVGSELILRALTSGSASGWCLRGAGAEEGAYGRRSLAGRRRTAGSRRPSERLRWHAVNDFSPRAYSLASRLASNGSDSRLTLELDALRALWRSLPRTERVEAADAARALAEAQAGVAPSPTLRDNDVAAQLALSGLDRIDVDAPPERRYDGPVTRMRC